MVLFLVALPMPGTNVHVRANGTIHEASACMCQRVTCCVIAMQRVSHLAYDRPFSQSIMHHDHFCAGAGAVADRKAGNCGHYRCAAVGRERQGGEVSFLCF